MWQLVGLVVLVVGVAFVFPAVFGKKPQPILASDRTVRGATPGPAVVTYGAVRWYHRLRGLFGLIVMTAAVGALLAVLLSAALLVLGTFIQ